MSARNAELYTRCVLGTETQREAAAREGITHGRVNQILQREFRRRHPGASWRAHRYGGSRVYGRWVDFARAIERGEVTP